MVEFISSFDSYDTLDMAKGTFNDAKSTLDMPKSTFDMQKSTFSVSNSTIDMQKSTLNVSTSTFNVSNSTLNVSNSTLNVSNSTLNTSKRSPHPRRLSPHTWQPAGDTLPHLYENSFFLSLTFPDIAQASHLLAAACEGVDAVEIRVDLLRSMEEEFVAEQVAVVRRCVGLPVIFTVRSVGQGGKFEGDEAAMFKCAYWGDCWVEKWIKCSVLYDIKYIVSVCDIV